MKERTYSVTRTAVTVIIGEAILLIAAILVVVYFVFRSSITDVYEEMDRSITGAACSVADEAAMQSIALQAKAVYDGIEQPEQLYREHPEQYYAAFASIQESDTYKEMWQRIERMRQSTASTCISYVILIPEKNYGLSLMDMSAKNVLPCGDFFEYNTADLEHEPGRKFSAFVSKSPTYGLVRTDGIPYYTDPEQGVYAYLVADIPLHNVQMHSLAFLLNASLISAVLTILICIVLAYRLRNALVQPIQVLSYKAKRFAGEHTENAKETDIFSGKEGGRITELRELSESLNLMEDEMNDYIGNLSKLMTEKARISTELELAESIQGNMLPNIFPAFPDRTEFEVYGLMNPAREIGGDFYDFFLIDEDHLAMVIADVSGKGIPAALFMMMSKILIKNQLLMGYSPKETIERVNNTICQSNENDMFVTVWLGILTISTGEIKAVNAGHEYPILCRAGGKFRVLRDTHGFVVGSIADLKYKEYEIQLKTGDMLFLYTDGLPEATNPNGELFGIDRILAVLNEDPNADLEELFVSMGIAAAEFGEDAPQFDDLTMLALRAKDMPKRSE